MTGCGGGGYGTVPSAPDGSSLQRNYKRNDKS